MHRDHFRFLWDALRPLSTVFSFFIASLSLSLLFVLLLSLELEWVKYTCVRHRQLRCCHVSWMKKKITYHQSGCDLSQNSNYIAMCIIVQFVLVEMPLSRLTYLWFICSYSKSIRICQYWVGISLSYHRQLPAIVAVTTFKQCMTLNISLSRVRKQGNLIAENCKISRNELWKREAARAGQLKKDSKRFLDCPLAH